MSNVHIRINYIPNVYKGKINRRLLSYIKGKKCKSKICLPIKIYIIKNSLILLKTNFIINFI